MERIIDIYLLAAVCVFIVDVSGWTRTWKGVLARWVGAERADGQLHPFDCSLCCTWWGGLVLCLCRGWFDLRGIALCALAAASTPVLLSAWTLCRVAVQGLLDCITAALQRWLY